MCAMAVTHGGNIFAVAREHGWDWRDVADFSASINPLGPAPGVHDAIRAGLDRIVHYPEREPARLRRALAECWAVDEDEILLGNGATELIFFLARMLAGTQVTLAAPVFSEFERAFPLARMTDLQCASLWPSEGMIVVTRPANPTGWTLPLEDLAGDRMMLVDESFLEFSGQPSAATLLKVHSKWMVLRSLTKFYALPGLRVGALVASAEIVRTWRQKREPWQVNVLAEEAALAALADVAHAAKSLEFVVRERKWLIQRLHAASFVEPLPSDANFIYVRLGYPAGPLCEYFLKHRILVRNCKGWPGFSAEAVRIAVRTHDENERLMNAWTEYRCD